MKKKTELWTEWYFLSEKGLLMKDGEQQYIIIWLKIEKQKNKKDYWKKIDYYIEL